MYVGFALSSTGFMLHGLLVHGWELQNERMSFVWVGWMAVANLVGAAVYVARVKTQFWKPGSGVIIVADKARFLNDACRTASICSAPAIRYSMLPCWLRR
jgi:hypothetical protein